MISSTGATSFWDIGEHELCESPHEETQFVYNGDHPFTVNTGYYTPAPGGKNPSKGHKGVHNLTFNPSEAEHVYRIEWQTGFIAWSIDGVELRRSTKGIPSPDPNGKGECAKIKFILRPNNNRFTGEARNRVRYLSWNKTGQQEHS